VEDDIIFDHEVAFQAELLGGAITREPPAVDLEDIASFVVVRLKEQRAGVDKLDGYPVRLRARVDAGAEEAMN